MYIIVDVQMYRCAPTLLTQRLPASRSSSATLICMCVYIHMCTYIYIHMYILSYIYIYIYIHISVYLSLFLSLSLYIYIYIKCTARRADCFHRWSRNPRPEAQKLSKLVCGVPNILCVALHFPDWLSGSLIGVRVPIWLVIFFSQEVNLE